MASPLIVWATVNIVWGFIDLLILLTGLSSVQTAVSLALLMPSLLAFVITAWFYYMESNTVNIVHSSDDEVALSHRYIDPYKMRCFDITSNRVMSMAVVVVLYLFIVLGTTYMSFMSSSFGDPPGGGITAHSSELKIMRTPYYQEVISSIGRFNGENWIDQRLQILITNAQNRRLDKGRGKCNCGVTLAQVQNSTVSACCFSLGKNDKQVCTLEATGSCPGFDTWIFGLCSHEDVILLEGTWAQLNLWAVEFDFRAHLAQHTACATGSTLASPSSATFTESYFKFIYPARRLSVTMGVACDCELGSIGGLNTQGARVSLDGSLSKSIGLAVSNQDPLNSFPKNCASLENTSVGAAEEYSILYNSSLVYCNPTSTDQYAPEVLISTSDPKREIWIGTSDSSRVCATVRQGSAALSHAVVQVGAFKIDTSRQYWTGDNLTVDELHFIHDDIQEQLRSPQSLVKNGAGFTAMVTQLLSYTSAVMHSVYSKELTFHQSFIALHAQKDRAIVSPIERFYKAPIVLSGHSSTDHDIQAISDTNGQACFRVGVKEAEGSENVVLAFSVSGATRSYHPKNFALTKPMRTVSPINRLRAYFRTPDGQDSLYFQPPDTRSFSLRVDVYWKPDYISTFGSAPNITAADMIRFHEKTKNLKRGIFTFREDSAVVHVLTAGDHQSSYYFNVTIEDHPRMNMDYAVIFLGVTASSSILSSNDYPSLASINPDTIESSGDTFTIRTSGTWYPKFNPFVGIELWRTRRFLAILGLFWLLSVPIIMVNANPPGSKSTWVFVKLLIVSFYTAFSIQFWFFHPGLNCTPADYLREYFDLHMMRPISATDECWTEKTDHTYFMFVVLPLFILLSIYTITGMDLAFKWIRSSADRWFILATTLRIVQVIILFSRLQIQTLNYSEEGDFNPIRVVLESLFFSTTNRSIGKEAHSVTMVLLSLLAFSVWGQAKYHDQSLRQALGVTVHEIPCLLILWIYTERNIDNMSVNIPNLFLLLVIILFVQIFGKFHLTRVSVGFSMLGACLVSAVECPFPTFWIVTNFLGSLAMIFYERTGLLLVVSGKIGNIGSSIRRMQYVCFPVLVCLCVGSGYNQEWAIVLIILLVGVICLGIYFKWNSIKTVDKVAGVTHRSLSNNWKSFVLKLKYFDPSVWVPVCLISALLIIFFLLSLNGCSKDECRGNALWLGSTMAFVSSSIYFCMSETHPFLRLTMELDRQNSFRSASRASRAQRSMVEMQELPESHGNVTTDSREDIKVTNLLRSSSAAVLGFKRSSNGISVLREEKLGQPCSSTALGLSKEQPFSPRSLMNSPLSSPQQLEQWWTKRKSFKSSTLILQAKTEEEIWRKSNGFKFEHGDKKRSGVEDGENRELGYLHDRLEDAERYVCARFQSSLLDFDEQEYRYHEVEKPSCMLRCFRDNVVKIWAGRYLFYGLIPYAYPTFETREASMRDFIVHASLQANMGAYAELKSVGKATQNLQRNYWKSSSTQQLTVVDDPMTSVRTKDNQYKILKEYLVKGKFELEERLSHRMLEINNIFSVELHPLTYSNTTMVIVASMSASCAVIIVCFVLSRNTLKWLGYYMGEAFLSAKKFEDGFAYYPHLDRYALHDDPFSVSFFVLGHTLWWLWKAHGVPVLEIADYVEQYSGIMPFIPMGFSLFLLLNTYLTYHNDIQRLRKGDYWFDKEEIYSPMSSTKAVSVIMFNTLVVFWVMFWTALVLIVVSAICHYVEVLRGVVQPAVINLTVMYFCYWGFNKCLNLFGAVMFQGPHSVGLISRNITFGFVAYFSFTVWWSFALQILILKFISWFFHGFLTFFLIHTPASSIPFLRSLDSGFYSYHAILLQDHQQNNPFVIVFCNMVCNRIRVAQQVYNSRIEAGSQFRTRTSRSGRRRMSRAQSDFHKRITKGIKERGRKSEGEEYYAHWIAHRRSQFRWRWLLMLSREQIVRDMRQEFMFSCRRNAVKFAREASIDIAEELVLKNQFLTSQEMLEIARSITSNDFLSVLDLSKNNLGPQSAKSIAEVIIACPIVKLDLSWTYLCDSGVRAICKVLCREVELVNLESINLAGNWVTDESAHDILKLVNNLPDLKEVILDIPNATRPCVGSIVNARTSETNDFALCEVVQVVLKQKKLKVRPLKGGRSFWASSFSSKYDFISAPWSEKIHAACKANRERKRSTRRSRKISMNGEEKLFQLLPVQQTNRRKSILTTQKRTKAFLVTVNNLCLTVDRDGAGLVMRPLMFGNKYQHWRIFPRTTRGKGKVQKEKRYLSTLDKVKKTATVSFESVLTKRLLSVSLDTGKVNLSNSADAGIREEIKVVKALRKVNDTFFLRASNGASIFVDQKRRELHVNRIFIDQPSPGRKLNAEGSGNFDFVEAEFPLSGSLPRNVVAESIRRHSTAGMDEKLRSRSLREVKSSVECRERAAQSISGTFGSFKRRRGTTRAARRSSVDRSASPLSLRPNRKSPVGTVAGEVARIAKLRSCRSEDSGGDNRINSTQVGGHHGKKTWTNLKFLDENPITSTPTSPIARNPISSPPSSSKNNPISSHSVSRPSSLKVNRRVIPDDVDVFTGTLFSPRVADIPRSPRKTISEILTKEKIMDRPTSSISMKERKNPLTKSVSGRIYAESVAVSLESPAALNSVGRAHGVSDNETRGVGDDDVRVYRLNLLPEPESTDLEAKAKKPTENDRLTKAKQPFQQGRLTRANEPTKQDLLTEEEPTDRDKLTEDVEPSEQDRLVLAKAPTEKDRVNEAKELLERDKLTGPEVSMEMNPEAKEQTPKEREVRISIPSADTSGKLFRI
ncbi:hypothetical protein AAMO2058_001623800 [Amorphochlora amoebiformis]